MTRSQFERARYGRKRGHGPPAEQRAPQLGLRHCQWRRRLTIGSPTAIEPKPFGPIGQSIGIRSMMMVHVARRVNKKTKSVRLFFGRRRPEAAGGTGRTR
jgi:hypothetical protein